MAIGVSLLLSVIVLVGSSLIGTVTAAFNRNSFPTGFVFGTASAAYQYEGAAYEGGRGPSIWDIYTHKHPAIKIHNSDRICGVAEKIADRSNGDVAEDFYHLYKGDVKIMKEMNMDAFRFSISWSRILPNGSLSGGVNEEGIKFYNNLIDELLSNGLVPFVTLFHWDFPQALEDEYGGFLSQRVVKDFQDYAELCYKRFGDRVKHWITLNEPWSYSDGGYNLGTLAPGRCSKWMGNCSVGDSGTEPYVVSHNQLLSHAAAVKVYRDKFQASQGEKIGITLVCHWFVPYSQNKTDFRASRRALDFMLGWFLNPLTFGDYPPTMRSLVKNRLPKFSQEQSKMVKGSFDFLGMNYYTANYAINDPNANSVELISYTTDSHANLTGFRNGIPIGTPAASNWLYVYPRGIRSLLLYIKRTYNNPSIYITENGVDEFNNSTLPLEEALKDDMRIDYYYRHLLFLKLAIQDGVDLRGYFAWSLLDNFEWANGYTVRFGINYVDYNNGLKRYPKHSAIWFKKFLQK